MREVKFEVTQCFYDNGQIRSEHYLFNGIYHNENGPAYREWWDNGQILRESYHLNGECHKENGPAVRKWFDDGKIFCEEHWFNGKKHNENGPAYREYDKSGELDWEEYFLNGVELSKEEFENRNDPCAGKKVTVDGKEYTLTPDGKDTR